jgi:hypothetical protein
MKQKKKLLIITAIAIVLVAIGVFVGLILGGGSDTGSRRSKKDDDALASYRELAETRAYHRELRIFDNLDDMDIPVDGEDYYAEDINGAFNDLYSSDDDEDFETGASETSVNDDYADYVNWDGSLKSTPSGGGNSKRSYGGPAVWVDMGEAIVSQILEDNEDFIDSELYEEWSDPDFWVMTGDVVMGTISSDLAETGEDFDPDVWTEFVNDFLIIYVEDADIEVDLSFLDDLVPGYLEDEWQEVANNDIIVEYVDEYFGDAWDDFRDEPIAANIPAKKTAPSVESDAPTYLSDEAGLLLAKYYPISYKSVGRLFYRETLNKDEKLAYDIMATAIQKGVYSIEINFGMGSEPVCEAVEALRRDFPEFFYLGNFGYQGNQSNVTKAAFSIDKYILKVGVDKAIAQINAATAPVIAKAKKLDKKIDRVKYIADYICDVNTYPKVLSEENSYIAAGQTIWSTLITHDAVCAGYSATFQYFLNRVGIASTPMILDGVHAWSLLELEGDYYYTDLTWVDSDAYNERIWDWFNFNYEYIEKYNVDNKKSEWIHQPGPMSSKLPVAHGTKYSYANWFAKAGPTPDPIPPRQDVTVVINGTDISSKLQIIDEGGVLYAEGESYIKTFADWGASSSDHWFDYTFRPKDLQADIFSTETGDKVFMLNLYTDFARRFIFGYEETIDLSPKIIDYDNKAFVPILSLAEFIGKAGYAVEIVIDGKTYSYFEEPVKYDPDSDTPPGTAAPQDPDATSEPDYPDEPDSPGSSGDSGASVSIIADGVDISDQVKTKVIDGEVYAEGASFVESLRYADMPEDMREYNYQYDPSEEELIIWLSEVDYDTGSYIRDEFEELLDKEAIILTSYFTDAALFILFIDSTEVVSFVEDEGYPVLIYMDEAPCIVDGEVYIPVQAFSDLTGYEIIID